MVGELERRHLFSSLRRLRLRSRATLSNHGTFLRMVIVLVLIGACLFSILEKVSKYRVVSLLISLELSCKMMFVPFLRSCKNSF